MKYKHNLTRRDFLKSTGIATASALLLPSFTSLAPGRKYQLSAHLWVYASNFPPDWNCNPIIDQVFSDLKYAGLDGVELMHVNLRDDKIIDKIKELIDQHQFPVTGSSYGADMWRKEAHQEIIADVKKVVGNLKAVGGRNFGISVHTPGRKKTEKELDDQAELLKVVREVCDEQDVVPNLHNHTYEVENGLHDLKGTLQRLPDFKLGPDIGWLAKAGVDPVQFVKQYGKQMVYMHLRDLDKNGEWTEIPGQGVIDFKGVADALKETRFSGEMAIELAFPSNFKPSRPLKDSWKLSQEYIARIFGD